MAKLGVVLKTSSLDFSAYGYIGAAIERLDLNNLKRFLKKYEVEDIAQYSEQLFDLALENIDRAIEDNADEKALATAFSIINLLASSENIIGDKPEKSKLLPQLIDKVIDFRIKDKTIKHSGDLKKILKHIETSIIHLSKVYGIKDKTSTTAKKAFLSTLLNRKTIVEDIDMLRELSGPSTEQINITNEEYDSFLKMALLFVDRGVEAKSRELRHDKKKLEHDAMIAFLKEADFSSAEQYISDDKIAMLLDTPKEARIKLLAEVVDRLSVAGRIDQLVKLRDNNLIDSKVFNRFNLFDLCDSGSKALSYGLSSRRPDIDNFDSKGFSLLHYACLHSNVELIKDLINQGANPYLLSNNSKLSPVHMLAMSNDDNKAYQIFEEMGVLHLNDHLTPFLAMKSGNTKLASALIDVSSSPEETISNILYRAVKSDDRDLVISSLEEMKSRNIKSLSVLIGGENYDLLKLSMEGSGLAFGTLLESGVVSGVMDSNILEKAVLSGNEKAVTAILKLKTENKINVDITAKRRDAKKGEFNILNAAYRLRMDIENSNSELSTKLMNSVDAEYKKGISDKIASNLNLVERVYNSINLLLEYGVGEQDPNRSDMMDVNVAFKVNRSSKPSVGDKQNFLLATYNELSLHKAALANDKPNSGSETFHASHVKRLEKTLYNLINHPLSDLSIPDQYGQNLLMLSVKNGDKSVFGSVMLRITGGDKTRVSEVLETKDSAGNTVLFHAAEAAQKDAFELLISEGARLRDEKGRLIRNDRKMTPLMVAANAANKDIIGGMNVSREDVLEFDDMKNTPMHYLAMGSGGDDVPEILDKFIGLGSDIEARNIEGRTPLIQAVISGNAGLVEALIKRGADINAADRYGNTPLIYACLLNDKSVIQSVLSSAIVDVNKSNNQGVSPYLIVMQRDGLESLRNDAKMNVADKKDSNSAEIKVVIDKWKPNSYEGLSKILISRGAEPYLSDDKSIYDRLLSITYALSIAQFSASATSVIASSSPFYISIAANLVKVSSSFAASNIVYNEVNKGVQSLVISWLTNGTELDNRIDLSDEIMIGSFRDEGLGLIKYGNSLKEGVGKHSNFISSSNKNSDAIYTVDALKDIVDGKSPEWLFKAHKNLTSRYISLQQKIENQPWYYNILMPWKGIGLNRAASEVLKAHEIIALSNSASFLRSDKGEERDVSFEAVFGKKGGLIDAVKNSPKKFMDMILYNNMVENKDSKVLKANEIIEQVLKGCISVSPKTFYLFSKFAAQRDKLMNCSTVKKDEFLHSYNSKSSIDFHLDYEFAEKLVDVGKVVSAESYVSKASNASYKAKSSIISGLNWLCGADDPYKIRGDIAGFLGRTAGTVASAYAFATADAGAAASVVNIGMSVAGFAASNATGLGVLGGLYLATQYRDTIIDTVMSFGSNAYSIMNDGISSLFGSKDVTVEIKDAIAASDLSVNTEKAFSVLSNIGKSLIDNKMNGYASSVVEDRAKSPKASKSNSIVAVSPIDASVLTDSVLVKDDSSKVNVEKIVNQRIEKEVQEAKQEEALKLQKGNIKV